MGAQLSAKMDSSPTPLSKRETEVLELLSNGLSYKMIADKLFLSFNTVNSHVKKIYEKLRKFMFVKFM